MTAHIETALSDVTDARVFRRKGEDLRHKAQLARREADALGREADALERAAEVLHRIGAAIADGREWEDEFA